MYTYGAQDVLTVHITLTQRGDFVLKLNKHPFTPYIISCSIHPFAFLGRPKFSPAMIHLSKLSN